MKIVVVVLLFCGVSMGQLLNNDAQGRQCVPGSSFKDKDGCNTCTCATDGSRYACTKKFCTTFQDMQSDEPKRCVPGSRFKADDGCNWCTCSENGEKMCTLMACGDGQIFPLSMKRDAKCAPGSPGYIHDDGCNWCRCSKNGELKGCTLRACGNEKIFPLRRKRDDNCVPNSSFMAPDGCNTCKCSENGKYAFCTRMECPPTEKATPYRRRRDVGW
uniref:Putative serine protease inhibitor i/ii n=1 Tax=Nyssomyia neivai TaxID=330878 RepID=A0A1L8DPE8_9DIPT